MLTGKDIRDIVESSLSGQIGTYTLPTGQVIPAVAIIPTSDGSYYYPDEGSTVTGLEIVIFNDVFQYMPVHANSLKELETFKIYLKFWQEIADKKSLVKTLMLALADENLILKQTGPMLSPEETAGIQQIVVSCKQVSIQC